MREVPGLFAVAFCMTLVACTAGTEKGAPSQPYAAPTASMKAQGQKSGESQQMNSKSDAKLTTSNEVASLMPQGYEEWAVERGDLNGDGVEDALLLVQDSHNKSAVLGEGPKRKLMIAIGGAGALKVVKSNDHLVPCLTCGGQAGDPFAFMRPTKDGFTLSLGGGSRERWAQDLSFVYDGSRKNWYLDSLTSEVTDTVTQKSNRKTYVRSELGDLPFENVDLEKLPHVHM